MCYIHEWESGRVSILDSSFLHYNVVSCANPYPRVAIYYCVIVKDSSQLCNNSNVKVGVDARDYVIATLVCPAVPVSYTTTVCVDMQACMYVHVEGCMRKSECIVLDVLGVLCHSFPLVAVMEGGQPDVEPQSSMPTRAPQVPDQVPLSTGNTSAKTGASKMCVVSR